MAPLIPVDRDGNPLAWEDPSQAGWWLDAWGGLHTSKAELLADIPSWVAREDERTVAYGGRS